jgi:hypothetical protein
MEILLCLSLLVPDSRVHNIRVCFSSYSKLPLQGDTLYYLSIQGLRIAGSQGVLVIAIFQALLMVLIIFLLHFVLVFGI